MFLKNKNANLINATKTWTKFASALVVVLLSSLPTAKAVEILTAKELASHCALFKSNPDGVDGQYCVRYIQGYIDGAIATDARVMLNAENAVSGDESFVDRAMRTRMPGITDLSRAAKLAGFCLGDPLPLLDVVNVVVIDLTEQKIAKSPGEPAMEVVYKSLVKNYPCE